MSIVIVGIDPGVTGAVAILKSSGPPHVFDMPVLRVGQSTWIDAKLLHHALRTLLGGHSDSDIFAYVEHIHGTPKMGVKTSHSLGLTLGSVLATLQLSNLSFTLVAPLSWKKHHNLIAPGATDGEKKSRALSLARTRFPTCELELAKYHNRGDALLIAAYGFHKHVEMLKAKVAA